MEEDAEAEVTGGELRYQKQDYHLHTMKCATQSEATTQGKSHYAKLVMTTYMWFTAFPANNQISQQYNVNVLFLRNVNVCLL